jgi:hypothetical protein
MSPSLNQIHFAERLQSARGLGWPDSEGAATPGARATLTKPMLPTMHRLTHRILYFCLRRAR